VKTPTNWHEATTKPVPVALLHPCVVPLTWHETTVTHESLPDGRVGHGWVCPVCQALWLWEVWEDTALGEHGTQGSS
jgi:hypothetical protein